MRTDAETVYNLLEDEIIPMFFERNKEGIPEQWIEYIKSNISEIAPNYITGRMIEDYSKKYYFQMIKRYNILKQNNREKLFNLTSWKRKIKQNWDNISVKSVKIPDSIKRPLQMGEYFSAEIILDIAGLDNDDIGVEILFRHMEEKNVEKILMVKELHKSVINGNTIKFESRFALSISGGYDYIFRIFPKNPMLPHRQDLPLVKWI